MKKTSPLSILLAFPVVGAPLGWGLYRSIKNSLPLFTAPPAPVVAPRPRRSRPPPGRGLPG